MHIVWHLFSSPHHAFLISSPALPLKSYAHIPLCLLSLSRRRGISVSWRFCLFCASTDACIHSGSRPLWSVLSFYFGDFASFDLPETGTFLISCNFLFLLLLLFFLSSPRLSLNPPTWSACSTSERRLFYRPWGDEASSVWAKKENMFILSSTDQFGAHKGEGFLTTKCWLDLKRRRWKKKFPFGYRG